MISILHFSMKEHNRRISNNQETVVPLHPIKILDDVLDEYRDYLRTEFRARDPRLREVEILPLYRSILRENLSER